VGLPHAWFLVYAASVPLVVNQWADLVWSQNSVWLWRMGRQPVRLDRNGRDELRLFDDGRTVVLGLSARFVDLRPPRLRLGCPDREHFETVVSTPSALVTRARLRLGEDDGLIVWRTCWRSAHRDVIVYGAAEGYKVYPSARLGGYVEPWLLIATETAAPEFLAGSLRLVNVVTGATRSFGEGGPIGQPAWKFEFDAVLLADGSVAWVGIDYSLFVQNMQIVRYALELTRPDGSQAELDTATTGVPSTSPLTALAAHGNSLSWLHDGQPRNYG
jgi:hypothetical protein